MDSAPENDTLAGLAARLAAARGAAPAFLCGGRTFSYADVDDAARRAAGWLRAQGVGAGDRVAVWLPNGIEWLALLFGAARLGACVVAANTRFRASELAYLLSKSGARMLVCQPGFRGIDFAAVLEGVDPAAAAALQSIAVVGDGAGRRILGRATTAFDLAALKPQAVDDSRPDALVLLFTTSGTTRGPKLVMHTQRTMVTHARRVGPAHGLDCPGAKLLGSLPLCGVFGMDSMLAAYTAGAPVLLMDSFDPAAAAALIREHAVTHMYASDEAYRMLLDAAPGHDPFPSARVFGFAAMQSGAAEFAREAWARRLPVLGLYGSSEVHALFSLQSPDAPLEERIEGGGYPASAPAAQVRICDVDTGMPVPPGVNGEIEVRAPTSFIGYLDNPEATRAAIDAGGWFRTGDLGRRRADGSFVYLTRRGDAMRLGGFLVDPTEIEAALAALPGVAQAQVVGVEIDGRNRCAAFVIPSPGAEPAESELAAGIAKSMAGYKVPARIWLVEEFPVTRSANATKIQRGKLREMALERLKETGTS